MTDNQHILAYLREKQADMTALLTQLVEMESPTDHKPSLDRLAAFLAAQLGTLAATVEILPQAEAGDCVRGRWGEAGGGVLLLCHMDTVWDLGTLASRPVRVEDGRLYGPGAFDMKGGIVNALWAVRALRELGLMPDRRITLLITSDEEIGSPASRPLIEAEARTHETAFVLEPAHPPRASLKTWRKGVGMYTVTVTGRSSHAGAAHDEGINAIEELAHQIGVIQALTDYAAGTTVNVGVIGGGTRSNVVPERAWAEVDVRVMTDSGRRARVDAVLRGTGAPAAGRQHRGDGRPEPPADGAHPGDGCAVRAGRSHRRASSASRSRRPAPVGDRTATSPPRWAWPRWMAWAWRATAATRCMSM